MLLAFVFAFNATVHAQTSVVVEVRVVEVPRLQIESLGGTLAKPGFATTVPQSLADFLVKGPKSRIVHRIELPVKSGISAKVRLDSRIAVTSSSSGDVQTYFDAGIGFEVTPKVFKNRDIELAMVSQVQIRRGPDADGVSLVVFENPPNRDLSQIHEGETIALGGFIAAKDRMALPDMPMLPDNPILNYLYPKARSVEDRPEILILLTPRIDGPLINAAEPVLIHKTPVTSTAPSEVTPPAVIDPPASIMTLAAVNPPPVSTVSTAGVTEALPVLEGIGGKYTVQVGAFDKLEKAESLRSLLSKKFEMVFVEKVDTTRVPYRVRVGRFPDMPSARLVERQLISEGFETYVTPLN
jgi:cell division septation protein DedD